jgi:SAM-dependent methyltransferase
MREEEIRKVVRERYAKTAQQSSSCCAPAGSCCSSTDLAQKSERTGYTKEELEAIPEGANLGLGCGNPVAIASLREGETVLDLGSGAGIDCFLASERVGERGKVIGIDMTPEMVAKARENARKGNYVNVEFRLGEIENLPAADNSVDVIISNCVINLVPDKRRAFSEAFRVLKPGGRMMVSDIVLLKELPGIIKDSIEAYVHCLSGALIKDNYMETIKTAGFQDVRIMDETSFPIESMLNDPLAETIIESLEVQPETIKEVAGSVLSVKVCGFKPN